jgi:hypothetical protein
MPGIVANLTPASGRQDHTTSPSARSAFVFCAARVHRIPHPTFVTIAKRPSDRGGIIGISHHGGLEKAEYFCQHDWTTQISLKRFNKLKFIRMRSQRLPGRAGEASPRKMIA